MARRTISQENKEFQYMKLAILAFYVAIVIRHSSVIMGYRLLLLA